MSTSTKPATAPRTPGQNGHKPDGLDADRATVRQQFVSAALHMTWQLVIVFLVPVIVGVRLDKVFHSGKFYTFTGLVLAAIGSALVMWHALQVANRLPVPKLTDEQKRAVRKAYEEDDE